MLHLMPPNPRMIHPSPGPHRPSLPLCNLPPSPTLPLQALAQALGDRKGIRRFGDFSAPLDEALVHVVLVREGGGREGEKGGARKTDE